MSRECAPVHVRPAMWKSSRSLKGQSPTIGASHGTKVSCTAASAPIRTDHAAMGDSSMTRTSLQAALFLAAALAFPHLQAPLAAQETGSLPETKAPAPVIQAPSA